MAYISGFVAAVPTGNKDSYIEHARKAWPLFQQRGARRMVENWEDDVPDGKVTSFPMAVKRRAGEAVVFSWIEWPDKTTYEAAAKKMESDPRWKEMPEMPFDGKRMIYGGFDVLVELTP